MLLSIFGTIPAVLKVSLILCGCVFASSPIRYGKLDFESVWWSKFTYDEYRRAVAVYYTLLVVFLTASFFLPIPTATLLLGLYHYYWRTWQTDDNDLLGSMYQYFCWWTCFHSDDNDADGAGDYYQDLPTYTYSDYLEEVRAVDRNYYYGTPFQLSASVGSRTANVGSQFNPVDMIDDSDDDDDIQVARTETVHESVNRRCNAAEEKGEVIHLD